MANKLSLPIYKIGDRVIERAKAPSIQKNRDLRSIYTRRKEGANPRKTFGVCKKGTILEVKKEQDSANRTIWKYLVKYDVQSQVDGSQKAEYKVQGMLKLLEE